MEVSHSPTSSNSNLSHTVVSNLPKHTSALQLFLMAYWVWDIFLSLRFRYIQDLVSPTSRAKFPTPLIPSPPHILRHPPLHLAQYSASISHHVSSNIPSISEARIKCSPQNTPWSGMRKLPPRFFLYTSFKALSITLLCKIIMTSVYLHYFLNLIIPSGQTESALHICKYLCLYWINDKNIFVPFECNTEV